jgi:hypothetical protein
VPDFLFQIGRRLAHQMPVMLMLDDALESERDQHTDRDRQKVEKKFLERMNRAGWWMDFHVALFPSDMFI